MGILVEKTSLEGDLALLPACTGLQSFEEALHNPTRSVIARIWAVYCVVFFANSGLLAAKHAL